MQSYSIPELRALNVVAMGGGTGLSTLLRGLKQYVKPAAAEVQSDLIPSIADLSAIVTVSDDGGSSGRLRKELNLPAPGDVRRPASSRCRKRKRCFRACSNIASLPVKDWADIVLVTSSSRP